MRVSKNYSTPLKAIRGKCIQCCGGHPTRVKDCEDSACCLWEFRQGKYPQKTSDEKAGLKRLAAHKPDCQCPICKEMRAKVQDTREGL